MEFQSLASLDPASFSIGPFGSRITKDNYTKTGVPVVRGVNLSRGTFLDEQFVYVSNQKADELSSCILLPGDLVFTHRGTIGQVSMIPRNSKFERYILSSSQVKARLNTQVALPEFYYYWFTSPKGQQALLANASTVGVPGIASPLATIKALRVPIPSIYEQRATATILGALDDKIAVNDRIAATTNQLLDTYFSRLIANTQRTIQLGEIVEFCYGKALKEENRTIGTVPVFGGNGISGWHDKPLVNGPGVIIGRKGANAGSISWSQCDFWPIDTSFFIRTRTGLPIEFIYFLLKGANLRRLVGDSAIPGLSRDIALRCEVAIPNTEAIHNFTPLARTMLELVDKKGDESRALVELRDMLLPKLMSGELRIKDAERQVTEVV
ncbi:restriction modification system component [Kutzneria sp. 744]|nr:restriction modification system component [Kutzneria sp. 744]